MDTVLVGGEVVKESGRLASGRASAAIGLIQDSRDRIVAALEPRGGLLPAAPDGWFEVTNQAALGRINPGGSDT